MIGQIAGNRLDADIVEALVAHQHARDIGSRQALSVAYLRKLPISRRYLPLREQRQRDRRQHEDQIVDIKK
jgi:hypothetical protein